MRNIFLLLLGLLLEGTLTLSATVREDRHIHRIDRQVAKSVFIPKGTWMLGGDVSYRENEEENVNFLILKDFEADGYTFSVSPYFGYFIKDNIAVGGRFAYNRDFLDLGNLDVELGGLEINLSEVYYLEHSFDAAAFLRTYMPIGSNKIFGFFNEVRLTYGYGEGKNSTGAGKEFDGTHQQIHKLNIGVAPGLTAFITDWAAAEVSIDVMGFNFKWINQTTNQIESGKRRVSSGNFKINLFSINLGMTLYI